MGNPSVRAEAGRFPHRVAVRIAGAIRSALFRGEGGPSASAREGLSPPPARGMARRRAAGAGSNRAPGSGLFLETVSEAPNPALARLPAVGRLLERERFRELARENSRAVVAGALRAELAEIRRALGAGAAPPAFSADPEAWLLRAARDRIARARGPDLRRVINATGVVVHTNLGRAPLSERAAQAVFRAASGYTNLEFDLETGGRGDRQDHLGELFRTLFPGRDSLVTGNAAGGVLLALDTLASRKEVIVSRGELVEIGGAFRIPEILEKSGARLVEVGTTNRTRLADYRRAVERGGASVGALLRVHQSNFRIVGFTEAAPTAGLVALGRERGIPVIEDFGSGNLLPLAGFGVAGDGEPTVADRIARGADLLVFSGDKLLGGPQAGILLGTREAISRCRENPLARALRPDKTQLAALQATLWSHATGRATEEIPVIRAIARPASDIRAAAGELLAALAPGPGWRIEVVHSTSRIGGGAAPGAELPTWCLALAATECGAEEIRRRLLGSAPPVVSRIEDDRVLLDLRALGPDETGELRDALQAIVGAGFGGRGTLHPAPCPLPRDPARRLRSSS